MIINSPVHKVIDSNAIYSANIEFLGNTRELYFSVNKEFKHMLSSLSDPLLISMLIPCMYKKDDITIKGMLSENLYTNLNKIQDILCIVIPCLHKINVHADNIVSTPNSSSKNVLAGFSAGIDAFVTFDDYFLNPKTETKITHFIFNNIDLNEAKVNEKVKRINNFLSEFDLKLLETRTNLHTFYEKKKIGFEQTHTLRNVAIPHFLGNNTEFLYSSTFSFDHISVKKSNDVSIIDTILLPLLSTPSVLCKSVGSEYSRIEKTFKVAEIEFAYNYLDVCTKPDKTYINCGACRKCTRALATFELVNKKQHFSKVFNLNTWESIRTSYLKNLYTHTQLNDKELYDYMSKNTL